MNILSIPIKKKIQNFLVRFNEFFTQNLSNLNIKNFKILSENLFFDKRFVYTIIIVIISIFAHLSTPAFYKNEWVIKKIKKQLEREFEITFQLPEDIEYSMFPRPSFIFQNFSVINDEREFGKIEEMKIGLSFNKFLNKEKINLQDIHIKGSQFQILNKDINSLINFFDKEINNKKLSITDSKIFIKDDNDEAYSILSLDKSTSYFDNDEVKNILVAKGEIFNNPLNLNLSNNYLSKNLKLNLGLNKIGKKLKINLNYLGKPNKASIEKACPSSQSC